MEQSLTVRIQEALAEEGFDGWLFTSFRGSDSISDGILRLDRARITTRRWFYYVPLDGPPQKVVHAIEPGVLDSLPGEKRVYLAWQELHSELAAALAPASRVAMQYSPMNAIPYISRVDAGTVDLIRSFGIEVVSSGDLVQRFEAVWTPWQLDTHLYAARGLREIVDEVFGEVARRVRDGVPTDEFAVQEFILERYSHRGLTSSDRPIVAVNAHSADPHYTPEREGSSALGAGDFLLIDIWARQSGAGSVYADITWTGFLGPSTPERYESIFQVVRAGRDAALERVRQGWNGAAAIRGCDVDEAARSTIRDAGYGPLFIHRTGHSIHEEDHGNGANIDGLETRDERALLPGTCFSIEPGVYIPGEFGVRSEIDVYLGTEGPRVTGLPIQEHVVPVLA
jgi:Xaa-Pro aminopeptidase